MTPDNPERDGVETALDDLLKRATALSDMPETDLHVLELLSVYVRFKPERGIAWFHLGDALRNMGRLEEGEDALLKALALAPSARRFAVYARLGMLAAKRSAPADAEKWFRLATTEARCPGWAWCLRGANLIRIQAYDLAKTCLDAAAEADDVVREEVLLNLAFIARGQRRYDEARRLVQEALAIDTDYEDAKKVLASLSDIEKTVEEAASVAARVSSANILRAGD